MSKGSGSSFVLILVFLAILLAVLPVSADNTTANVTPAATISVAETTANATPAATTAVIQTTSEVTPVATATITQATTNATPVATTIPATTNATPATTTVAATPTATTVAATPPITATAYPATGTVIVYSSPAGASILIDGIYIGTAPRTINNVPAGNHILRLSLSGYHDYEGSIYVVPGQTDQSFGALQPMGQVTGAVPTPTAAVTVIVPVIAVTPEPAGNPNALADSGVIAAIIGAIGVVILSAAKIFTHVRPPRKE